MTNDECHWSFVILAFVCRLVYNIITPRCFDHRLSAESGKRNITMSDESFSGAVEVATETVVRPGSRRDKKTKRQPPYHVILWNDEHHTYHYVIAMLQQIFGHPTTKGMQIAEEVDSRGKAVVLTTAKEHAEFKRDQIHSYGKDIGIEDCKGSMSASIEPSE